MGNNYENEGFANRSRKGGRSGQKDYYDCNGCDWETAPASSCNDCDDCGMNIAHNGCGECDARTADKDWNRSNGGRRDNQCECKVCATTASGGSALRVGNNGDCIDGETHVYFESCDGFREVNLASECHNEDSLGRAMDVTMKLCNVCPGRRCAVGVHLTEMDESGNEYARGFRAFTVPAHNGSQNRDLVLPSLRFILPEDVSLAHGGNRRHFVVRATNHYMEEPSNGCWKHQS